MTTYFAKKKQVKAGSCQFVLVCMLHVELFFFGHGHINNNYSSEKLRQLLQTCRPFYIFNRGLRIQDARIDVTADKITILLYHVS